MNILPKKKWHVRTKENVARVRRDQKKAAEEAERAVERAKLAEQEFKVNLLRKNAEQRFVDFYGVKRDEESGSKDDLPIYSSSGHVNFFVDLETEERKNYGTGNKEYEEEKRKEREEYESKVGILKYLGEGSNELTKQKSWYEKLPEKPPSEADKKKVDKEKEYRCGIKSIAEAREPPKYEKKHKEKKKKHKHKHKREKDSDDEGRRKHKRKHSRSYSESDDEPSSSKQKKPDEMLQKLRLERIKREENEKAKAAMLLFTEEEKKQREKEKSVPKYSSQFNPELARQNRPR